MPYEINDESLPEYIKKAPSAIRGRWVEIFNKVYTEHGDELAFIVANKWLLRQTTELTVTARTDKVMEKVTFILDTSKELITRTDSGDEYISFKLADNVEDELGVQLPEFVLKSWADEINANPIVGDIDHVEYNKLIALGYTEDQIQEVLQGKKGIAKTVKAVYDKGKLWVKALIDKRYRKTIEKSKGVSLEAIISRDSIGNITDGNLLGFTFAVENSPIIQGTEIHNAS